MTYDVTTDAAVSKSVLFVGDSNMGLCASALTLALPHHVPAFTARLTQGVRGCPGTLTPCATDYWAVRLPQVLAKFTPEIVVTNLGINDTWQLGTPTSQGYSFWGQKVAWFLDLLPDVPVVWSNLPTQIEPAPRQPGCLVVNTALMYADALFPQFTLAAWNTVANTHPEYITTGDVHLTPAGQTAYANLIAATLDTLE